MSLDLQFTYRFEAGHRLTSSVAPACATPHGHTWHVSVRFRGVADSAGRLLNHQQVLVEFGELKKSWKRFVQDCADHSYFHHKDDVIISALKREVAIPRLLWLPGDPTTELMAAAFATKLRTLHAASGLTRVQPLSLSLRETPVNAVHFRFPKPEAWDWVDHELGDQKAWWNSPDPLAR